MSASTTELIGLRVRHFRDKAGMSQRHLGQLVGRSGQWVSAIERAERNAGTDRLTTLVPLLLALRVSLLTFLTKPIPEAEPFSTEWLAQMSEALNLGAQANTSAWSGRTLGEAGQDLIVIARDAEGVCWPMNRRQAGKRGFQVLGVFGLGFALNQDQTQAVEHALSTQTANLTALRAYEEILIALRHAEDQLGSSPSLAQAAEIHLDTVKGWLAAAEPNSELATELARLTVEFSISCAWMAYDSGNFHKAIGLHRDALPLATHVLKDRPLAAHLMGRIADARGDLGSLGDAVRDADHAVALVASTEAWRVRALVEAQCSVIHARRGDWDASRSALGRAEDALARTDTTDGQYVYFVDPRILDEFGGIGLTYLGKHDQAQAILRKSATTMPAQYPRDRAGVLTTLAESFAGSGNLGQACEVAGEAADLLRATSSRRLQGRLGGLHRKLVTSRFPEHAVAVRDLGAKLQGL